MWYLAESNCGHKDFQSFALPTELRYHSQFFSRANIICFTTGRGSCFGFKPTPSIKIATNTNMYNKLEEDMDINAGTIMDNEKTIEEKIYGGFYSNEDKSVLQQFQLASWEDRLNLLSRFSDERMKQLGRRLIAFNAPELLTTKEQDAFDAYLISSAPLLDVVKNLAPLLIKGK